MMSRYNWPKIGVWTCALIYSLLFWWLVVIMVKGIYQAVTR